MEDETTNLEAEAPEVEETQTDGAETDQIELDEHGNPVDPEPKEADDEIEIEREGKKFKLPKALESELLMQADYTRKTQELAAERNALAVERQQFQALSQAEVAAQAQIIAIDQTLAEYQRVDWDAWEDQDPQAAQKAWRQFQTLQGNRQAAVNQYGQAQQQRTLHEQQETAKRMQQGQQHLAREIPGWNEDKAKTLLDYGQKTLGFSRAELDAIDDPRMIVALNKAFERDQAASKQKTVQKVQQQQAVQPAAKVSGGKAPARGLDDRMSADEWLKRRNAQLSSR